MKLKDITFYISASPILRYLPIEAVLKEQKLHLKHYLSTI